MSSSLQIILNQLDEAVAQLNRSERGRAIKSDLSEFCRGPFAAADARNVQAVIVIIQAIQLGYAGTVLEMLLEGQP